MSSADVAQGAIAPSVPDEILSAPTNITAVEEVNDDLLQRLPYEILTDVMMRLGSPQWVLAVARTSQYCCNTLLDEKSQGIWKANRQAVGLREPLPILTESAYAAFVFDGGPCEICKKHTDNMYTSFAIKLRLCNRTECQTEMRSNITTTNGDQMDTAIMSWTPSMEDHSWMGELTNINYWPTFRARLRTVDYHAAQQAFTIEVASHTVAAGIVAAAKSRHAKEIEQNQLAMKFAVDLQLWKKQYAAAGQAVKFSNHEFSKKFAKQEGFEYWDLCATETYKALLRHKTMVHERITDDDAKAHLFGITADLTRMRTRRDNRKAEEQLRANRATVEKHYHGYCAREVMPSWPAFCALPLIAELMKTVKEVNLAKALRNQPLRGVLEGELEAWRARAREALCAKAGLANEVPVSSLRAHPVEQVNVRFTCGKCKGVQRKYEYDESLDFAGVCAHVCPAQSGGKRKRHEDASSSFDNFVFDVKASEAMTELVRAAGLDPSRKDRAASLKAVGSELLCKSCVPPLVLHYSSVLGHAHRHEHMQIQRITSQDAMDRRSHPIVPGLTRALLHLHKPQGKLRQLSNAKEFSCRHCANGADTDGEGVACGMGCGRIFPTKRLLKKHWALHKNGGCADDPMGDAANPSTSTAAAAPATAPSATALAAPAAEGTAEPSTQTEKPKTGPRMFTFNGMRSHLAEKHQIALIRDEDYECHRDARQLKSIMQAVKEQPPAKKPSARSCVAA
ncbi:uncharacterized protein SCHCODRAFT_02640666 [Schizophyllum commune H4-8]|uniref:C2H2-type domain-containing protein n=1 Tax=Schizophyllum commune (strain H4-8 / FGSC 9210) TaxID=578458 RepID=D8QH89_SCHCM|nr:uncharacterized protein SCHCODRAFT_02640666 [Schizophyllum commune H4-8]KAI5887075.1 hypothetical protein SCHCODRAFT_02640666 [Schizophyllum commune H4-8]